MQRTRDLEDRKKYYRLRGVAQHTIKTAEKTYWRDFCSTMDKGHQGDQGLGNNKKDEWNTESAINTNLYR